MFFCHEKGFCGDTKGNHKKRILCFGFYAIYMGKEGNEIKHRGHKYEPSNKSNKYILTLLLFFTEYWDLGITNLRVL